MNKQEESSDLEFSKTAEELFPLEKEYARTINVLRVLKLMKKLTKLLQTQL